MPIVYSAHATSTHNVATRTRALLNDLTREYPRGTMLPIGHHARRVSLPHFADGVPLEVALAQTLTDNWWQPEWEYRHGK